TSARRRSSRAISTGSLRNGRGGFPRLSLGGSSETAFAARAVMLVPRQGRRERPYHTDTGATEDAASGRAARAGRDKGVSLAPPMLRPLPLTSACARAGPPHARASA